MRLVFRRKRNLKESFSFLESSTVPEFWLGRLSIGSHGFKDADSLIEFLRQETLNSLQRDAGIPAENSKLRITLLDDWRRLANKNYGYVHAEWRLYDTNKEEIARGMTIAIMDNYGRYPGHPVVLNRYIQTGIAYIADEDLMKKLRQEYYRNKSIFD